MHSTSFIPIFSDVETIDNFPDIRLSKSYKTFLEYDGLAILCTERIPIQVKFKNAFRCYIILIFFFIFQI